MPDAERNAAYRAGEAPGALARVATRAELREPGAMERAWNRVGSVPGPGVGLGGMFAGSLLASMAGTVLGTVIAQQFFTRMRSLTRVSVACEARHATWFSREACEMLREFDIVQVRADPLVVPLPAFSVHGDLVYLRLHGSPQMYHSSYDEAFLDRLTAEIRDYLRSGKKVWCVFDNTASGAAQPNALSLLGRFSPT